MYISFFIILFSSMNTTYAKVLSKSEKQFRIKAIIDAFCNQITDMEKHFAEVSRTALSLLVTILVTQHSTYIRKGLPVYN